jgi:hypothetical protein
MWGWAWAWALASVEGSAAAGVVFRGRAMDAAASVAKFSHDREDFHVPFAGKEVTVDLVPPTGAPEAVRSWKAMTDADGNFTVDTGLEAVGEGARFVVRAEAGGGRLFSPFYGESEAPQRVSLYAITEDPQSLKARLEVNYSVERAGAASGEAPRLHVQVILHVINSGERMYVGRPGRGGWREVWRLPLPEGAKIVRQSSPDPASPGWRASDDGRWLLLDTPIAGILDLERQGVSMAREEKQEGWEVVYTIPGSQTLVQAYPLAFPLEKGGFVAWCLHGDQSLESSQLAGRQSEARDDPVSGRHREFDVAFSTRPLPDETVVLALTTDNLPLDQVSRSALFWVGGFVLVLVLAMLLGLAFGRRGPAPETLLASLSGEEVLDRIADLDRRFEAKRISEPDYRRYREALVELAAEELDGGGTKAAAAAPGGRLDLPGTARRIVERIEAIDASGNAEPAAIAERTQLLDALFRELSRARERERAGG